MCIICHMFVFESSAAGSRKLSTFLSTGWSCCDAVSTEQVPYMHQQMGTDKCQKVCAHVVV